MSSFGACAQTTRELNERLQALEQRVSLLEIPALAGREWFELLKHKLLPQLSDDTYLVVAVVGGRFGAWLIYAQGLSWPRNILVYSCCDQY